MKKVLFGSLLLGLLFILPGRIQAQFYSSYIYNNNALVNRALAYQRAKAGYNRKVSRKRTSRKVVRRRTRRVSMLLPGEIKFKPEIYLAKRADIV